MLNRHACLILASCLTPYVTTDLCLAGTSTVTGEVAGKTQFLASIFANYNGGTISTVSFSVSTKPGSFVRPIGAVYSASYLAAQSFLTSSTVTIPVFGLYAGSSNTVTLVFTYTVGSTSSSTASIATQPYTDPCTSPTLTTTRGSINALNFDYFILKNECSPNTPAFVDTDGNFRWIGTTNVATLATTIYKGAIYSSDQHSGLNRTDIPTGKVLSVCPGTA